MRFAVCGDAVLDIEVPSGSWDGDCPENTRIPIFRGPKPIVYAGGAANVAHLLTANKVSADLYCDGPGHGDRTWIGQMLKQVCHCNRIVWSNEGQVPLKLRGLDCHNNVLCRIDAEEKLARKHGFSALETVLDDVKRGVYDAVILSNYEKGFVNEYTEQVIIDILKHARCGTVDFKGKDYLLYSHATAIVPNLPDSLRIFGTSDPCEIQRMVGCKVVYVTRGRDTVLVGCKDGTTEIGVGEPVDDGYVIGAGDVFTVGVSMALASGRSYIEAGMAGVKLASEYVRKGRKSVLR